MKANISAWAIRNPAPCILLFTVLTGLGLVSFRSLPITYFPPIDVPEVTVTVTDDGVAPSQMETEVTRLVEDAVAALVGVVEITSSVGEGRSETTVEFELGVPVERAVADVQNAVAGIRSDLPATVDEPVVGRIDAEAQAVATYAVVDRAMTPEDLSWFVDDVVIRRLSGIAGIGRIERIGGVDREIQVRLDPDRLDAFGVTASGVTDALRATWLDLSGGLSRADGRERAITTVGTTRSLQDLAEMPVALPGGLPLRLADLGTIADAAADPADFALLNGARSVGITIYAARGASDVAVAEAAADALRDLARSVGNLSFDLVDTSVDETLGNYHAALHTLFEGAILTVVVVFLFLRDWRATLIAAIALPLAVIPTFWAIGLLGFSLNILSLLAITLVTGILVDDAIVEIENIVRHGQRGVPPFQAALDASDEIGLAVIAISWSIIAVFAPVGLMGGVVGQYFRQFGLTVAIAVFFSLLVARLVTPVLAAYLLPAQAGGHGEDSRLRGPYIRLLAWSLRRRWLAVGGAGALFAASIVLAASLPSAFLPEEDTGRLTISVELPPGSTLDDTRGVATGITDRLRALPEVRTVFIQGGTDASGLREARRMAVLLDLGPPAERGRALPAIERAVEGVLAGIPDIRFEILNDQGGRDVSFSVLGRDGAAAGAAAARILQELDEKAIARAVTSSGLTERPILVMNVDAERAADAGVSAEAIAGTLRVSTVGASEKDLPVFVDGGRRIPVRLQLADGARDDLGVLMALAIPSASGAPLALSQIAELGFGTDVATIERFDRERRIDIAFDVPEGLSPGEGLAAVRALDAVRALPPGIRIVATGDSDDQDEVFDAFGSAMGSGIMLVLVVLILLFGGPLTPLTILVTLPLSVCGVVATLMISGVPVSLPVVIGILMLMGIVTKNAIMLVDFAILREAEGMPRREAIIEAAGQRLRPILMTTLAMIAGMMPAAIGTGQGSGFRAPMAIAVIGGLAVSTVLSLFVVPSLHWLMADLGDASRRLFGRFMNDDARPGHAVAAGRAVDGPAAANGVAPASAGIRSAAQ